MWCQTCSRPVDTEAQEAVHRVYDHVLEEDLTNEALEAILGPEESDGPPEG